MFILRELISRKAGIDALLCLNTQVSETYRDIQQLVDAMKGYNKESIKFDAFYLQDLITKKQGLSHIYQQLLIQICIHNSCDMKSWQSGCYTYNREEIVSWVHEFNTRYDVDIPLEEVIKSLRFDYDMNIELTRTER